MKHRFLILVAICTSSVLFGQKIDFDKKLKDLGVELYKPTPPIANYVKAVRKIGRAHV